MDPIPVLSQLKSLVQVTCGQREAAKQTQINFSRQCLVISQARSAVEAIKGDQAAARETQKEFLHFLKGVLNSVPVVGHISGGIHYAVGDKAGGDQAMKAASHTTAVMIGGIGGVFIAGPIGAVGLGMGAGAAIDIAITGIDTAVHWKKDRKVRTFGLTEPFSEPKNAGKWFDAVFGLIADGFTAHFAGKLALKAKIRSSASGSPNKVPKTIEKFGAILPSAPSMTVFLRVSKGVLYFLKKKAIQIGKDIDFNKMKDFLVIVCSGGQKIYVWIKDKTVHVRDASGNDQILQENIVYSFRHSVGEIVKSQDKMGLDFDISIDLIHQRCYEETVEENSDKSFVEETEEESSDESSTEETEEECSDESSIGETEVESSDESSSEQLEEESSDESSTEETEDESSDESFSKETEEESSDESSTEETEEESSDESSSEELEEESSDESSTEETEEESSDESSSKETEEESSDESSTDETEEESSDESSTENTEVESRDESSTEETEEESSDESSTENTEEESSDKSSTEETEEESSDESSTDEKEEESSDESSTEETEEESSDESSANESEAKSSLKSSIGENEKESIRLRRQKWTSEEKRCKELSKSGNADRERARTRKQRRPC